VGFPADHDAENPSVVGNIGFIGSDEVRVEISRNPTPGKKHIDALRSGVDLGICPARNKRIAQENIHAEQARQEGRSQQDPLPLFEDEETGSLWIFDGIAVRGPLKGKRLAQMVGYRSFWFAWAAFFPETLVHEF
jgi:hypothetical protein